MFKIGFIGAGIIAATHKAAIEKNSETELCAVCDIDINKANTVAKGTNASIYTDYKDMLEKEMLDAVIINLPHFLHRDVTVYCLDKGINVLVEKPMAISVEECIDMKNAAIRNDKKLVIGHLQRYYPAYRELKKIIDAKKFGDVCVITETRNIDYFTNRPEWFLDKKKAGGGIVMNYCAHTLDKIFYLIGTDVKEVHANIANKLNDKDIEAQAQVLLKFNDDISASLSYCSSRINYSYETYFYFTDAVAKIENGKYLLISSKDSPFERIQLDYDAVAIEKQLAEFVKELKGEPADVVDADYAAKVIAVIEEILK